MGDIEVAVGENGGLDACQLRQSFCFMRKLVAIKIHRNLVQRLIRCQPHSIQSGLHVCSFGLIR